MRPSSASRFAAFVRAAPGRFPRALPRSTRGIPKAATRHGFNLCLMSGMSDLSSLRQWSSDRSDGSDELEDTHTHTRGVPLMFPDISCSPKVLLVD